MVNNQLSATGSYYDRKRDYKMVKLLIFFQPQQKNYPIGTNGKGNEKQQREREKCLAQAAGFWLFSMGQTEIELKVQHCHFLSLWGPTECYWPCRGYQSISLLCEIWQLDLKHPLLAGRITAFTTLTDIVNTKKLGGYNPI